MPSTATTSEPPPKELRSNQHNSNGKPDINESTVLVAKDDVISPSASKSDSAAQNDKQKYALNLKRRSLLQRVLQAYSKFTASSGNQDKLLKTLQFSIWMIARFYFPSTSNDQGGTASLAQEALYKLSGQFSTARYVSRLLGWPTAMEGAQSGSWGPTNKTLAKAMAWSMVCYYPLEHLAFLKWQAPDVVAPSFKASHRLAERATSWSCRCWLTFIFISGAQNVLALKEHYDSVAKMSSASEAIVVSGGTLSASALRNQQLTLLQRCLTLVPAIHWSMPSWDSAPLFPNEVPYTLMWAEAIVGLYQCIRNMIDEDARIEEEASAAVASKED